MARDILCQSFILTRKCIFSVDITKEEGGRMKEEGRRKREEG
jgi:hypothetical protein